MADGQDARTFPFAQYRIPEILMKIPPTSSRVTPGGAAPSGETGRAKGSSGNAAVTPAGADGVTLSEQSTKLHALASSLSGPEFDRAKVDQIKQAIHDGKLVIRTDVVADRMIDDVKSRIAKG